MKSIAALTTILATTSAFAPTATKQTSSSAIQAFENEVGAQVRFIEHRLMPRMFHFIYIYIRILIYLYTYANK